LIFFSDFSFCFLKSGPVHTPTPPDGPGSRHVNGSICSQSMHNSGKGTQYHSTGHISLGRVLINAQIAATFGCAKNDTLRGGADT
jgi:hypothetical protein